VAAGATVRPVWENELGGLTFELIGPGGRRFLKWAPTASGLDLSVEAVRLRWAAHYVVVPEVLDIGHYDDGNWLLTRAVPGTSAISRPWQERPAVAVAAIGAGLRQLHDRLPRADCPFSWSAESRIAEAHRAVEESRGPETWHEDHRHLSPHAALLALEPPPPVDRLVVCHGDACAPNTLIDDRGACSGHVDLGMLGVADRWADLAVATWSTQWNYGPGWEAALLEAYGIEEDPERTSYYRLLWDLAP
jgi:kanamycin kinase